MQFQKLVRGLLVLALCLVAGCSQEPPADTISYLDLLQLQADAVRTLSTETPGARLVSSYDPSGGNDDHTHFLRNGPSGWKVLADLQGPGYVSRAWFTGSKDGKKRIRFYFDGEKEPSLETTLEDWCGGQEPFTQPLAAYEPYCWFSWLPIPFKKSLVIMEEAPVEGEKLYYQISYNRLPDGKTIDSFSLPLNEETLAAIAQLKQAWLEPAAVVQAAESNTVELAPMTSATALELTGPATILSLHFQPDISGLESVVAQESLLRALTVKIYWDDHSEPSVDVPLGAWCGSMWSRMRYQSRYFGMASNTLHISFPMPFKRASRIVLHNAGTMPCSVAVTAAVNQGVAEGLYFHSGWRKSASSSLGQSHEVLTTTGSGRYVGCLLGVRSLDRSWWVLEADELMFVDGETEPSWKGTGLEDYFNGGWYYGNALAAPFHGIVFKAPFRTVQYRLHPLDPVEFKTSFQMTFERGPKQASRASFESVSYYYLDAPHAANSDVGRLSVHPEADPFRNQTLMTEVNNRERLGDYSGARDAVVAYLEDFSDVPFKADLLKRIEHYEHGEHIADGTGLLGVYANMPVVAYIDGVAVGQFGHPNGMQFLDVAIKPGRHVFALEAGRQNYPDWVQAGLKVGDTIIGTDSSWKMSFTPAPGWNQLSFDDSNWKELGGTWVKGPPEVPYIFSAPHPHIDLQSRPWGIRPSSPWPAHANKVYYRKVFTSH
jgi:hypothetical protein